MIIELNGIPVEVTWKKIKNINLRIYPPDGAVKVSAPMRYSESLLRQTLEIKSAWIQQQRERIQSQPTNKEFKLETGATISFQGNNYLIIIEEHHGPTQIKINEELMHFYIHPNSSDKQKQILLDNWYKRQMHALLPDLISHWETIVGVKVAEWGIKKMKTRWGSCNTKAARIWLNLNLIKKPQICLEYVLVHELVHLHEPSHNKRFYALMSKFMPKWREYRQVLEGQT